MKKYYNKALFYQSFYNGKWGILGGIILLFLFSYINTTENMSNSSSLISWLDNNHLYLGGAGLIFVLFLSILLVYVMITGFNKRNNITFITSGPYTKEDVKKNEFLFLFSTLCLFTLVVAYTIMCVYIRNKELLPYIHEPWINYIFTIIKVFVLGLAFIVYLSFMDMLFSNLIFTLISIVGLPIAILCDTTQIGYIYLYGINLYSEEISSKIYYIFNNIMDYINSLIDFIIYDSSFYESEGNFYIIVATYLIISIVIYYISKFINKKVTINNINKFFIFPIVGKITVFTGIFSVLLFMFNYYFMLRHNLELFLIRNGLYINNLEYTLGITLVLGGIIAISLCLTKLILKKINKYI